MRIGSLKNYNYNSIYIKPCEYNRKSDNNSQSNKIISFKGSPLSKFYFSIFNANPLNRFKNFTIDEYLRLSQKDLSRLRSEYEAAWGGLGSLSELVHDATAICMKNSLDDRFGQDKYIVVPIGRSLSSIGKVLGYKIGEDNVKNIPMSTARRFVDESYLDQAEEELSRNAVRFVKYLESVGLGPDSIKTSGKNYIITDCCISGNSLKGAKSLFESPSVWGQNDNVHFIDVMDLLADNMEIESLGKLLNTANLRILLKSSLDNCRFKVYSFVSRCNSLSDTKFAAEFCPRVDDDMCNLFRFKLLDNEMSGRK